MKNNYNESVLHDWVHTLTFQQQALLMTGMRGPDTCSKHNAAKAMVRYLRGIVLKPAGTWNGKNNNDFMWGEYDNYDLHMKLFWDDHDAFPHHFIMHLIHCAEVVAYKHPDYTVRTSWSAFYLTGCDSFHMMPESVTDMDRRLDDFGTALHVG